jgi:hypothetical protein
MAVREHTHPKEAFVRRPAAHGALATLGLAAAAAAAISLGGCSSSSSAGSAGSPSGIGTPTFHATAPGVYGPNGNITAPATNAPSSGSPGGSVVFPHVSAKQRPMLANHLAKFPGVRTVTYYPQFHQLQVFYFADATSTDRQRVYRYVTSHDPAAAGATSPSSSPS